MGERVLEGVAEPVWDGCPAVERWFVVAVEVASSSAGHDDRQDTVHDAGLLVHAKSLVVDADRFGFVAGGRPALEDYHGQSLRREQ